MFRATILLAVISTGLAWIATAQESSPVANPSTTILPGARIEIDAAKFPSLQAAFDAIPPEGGVVRIPPGTFNITEPLVVSRSDVLIQGAGAASHIKNMNMEGQPALVVKHPDGEKVKSADQL